MNLRKELTKMPKAYMLDTGLMNSLINNFQPFSGRLDKGLLWENMYFRVLCDMYGMDEIFFWRTADGNEVDYVLPRIEKPAAFEAKADYEGIKEHKYIKFREAYPDIPLSFRYLYPFDEEFFRKIYYFME